MRAESIKKTGEAIPSSNGYSFEVTGLGVIAALMVAFAGMVSDGTLPRAQYLVFAAFLLVSAAALAWRIFKLSPARAAQSGAPRPPGPSTSA